MNDNSEHLGMIEKLEEDLANVTEKWEISQNGL